MDDVNNPYMKYVVTLIIALLALWCLYLAFNPQTISDAVIPNNTTQAPTIINNTGHLQYKILYSDITCPVCHSRDAVDVFSVETYGGSTRGYCHRCGVVFDIINTFN